MARSTHPLIATATLALGLLCAGAADAQVLRVRGAGTGSASVAASIHVVVPVRLHLSDLERPRLVQESAEFSEFEWRLRIAANTAWDLEARATAGRVEINGGDRWHAAGVDGAEVAVLQNAARTNPREIVVRFRVYGPQTARRDAAIELALRPTTDGAQGATIVSWTGSE